MGSISSLSSNFLQEALQGTGLSINSTPNGTSGGTTAVASQQDSTQLSPLAQLLSELQQLQQSNPARYQEITEQIATNLTKAAQTAQSAGNSTAASQLTQLATDFTNASQTGQLPNIQDLAEAIGGHHHHSHGGSGGDSGAASGASSDTSSTASTTASGTASSSASSATSAGTASSTSASVLNQTLSQFLVALESNQSQNDSLNPGAIILDTLYNAGISGINGF